MSELNPFESPSTRSDKLPASALPDAPIVPYKSAATRATLATALLAVVVIADVLLIGSTYMEIQLLQTAMVQPIDEIAAHRNDSRQQTLALTQTGLVVLSAITFLMFWHRGYRNLRALGAIGLSGTPGWAVGWFFVPIANLVKPYQIAQEIWQASDPVVGNAVSEAWKSNAKSALIKFWWAAWLIATITIRASGSAVPHEPDLQRLILADQIFVVGLIAHVIAGLLAIVMIRRITVRQTERATKFGLISDGFPSLNYAVAEAVN